MLTRRCAQRQFLLRPDETTNQTFLYCLAVAAERCQVGVIYSLAMSNHHHTLVYDEHGRYPEFLRELHRLVAKCQNCRLGRWENFWAAEQANVLTLVEAADVVRKLVYAATNPVKDCLVEKASHWPGAHTLKAFRTGEAMRISRPHHFFAEGGTMPEEVTLTLCWPDTLEMSREEAVARVMENIAEMEATTKAERLRGGKPLLGRKGVLRQSFRASPSTFEPRRSLRPRVAARSKWARIEALLRNQVFLSAYRYARELWLATGVAEFPAGTYALANAPGVVLAKA